MSTRTHDFDVVVVGCGIAGLSAALTAHEGGARVAVLERSVREERGGNTRWTEAFLRMKSEDAVSDDFEEHFMKNAGHYLDPGLVRETSGEWDRRSQLAKTLALTDPEIIGVFAERAGPTLRWLKRFGLRFEFLPSYFITTSTTRMAPVGGGLALVETLADHAERQGIPVFYRTTAHRLLVDDAGAIAGLVATDGEGRAIEFRAPAVILACGGFEGNPEMQARYYGAASRYIRPVARGGYHNKGEGIRMALDLGAAPCGDYTTFHAEPIDPRSAQPEPLVMIFNYGILVNKLAERFIDEAPGTVDATYEAITRRILEQPEGIAWLVVDSRLNDVPNWKKAVRTDQLPVSADSLDGLAREIGLDATALRRTVDAYNGACRGDRPFDALRADGLATVGLAPPKSNWARPVDRAPFMAYPITCSNCFTFGGVKVDARARVLDADGVPIAGLYAAGEVMGIYYQTYTGATSVLRGAVFGRIAGEDAAQRTRIR